MVVIESQYFPPIEYFSLLKKHAEVTIDGYEYFVKQTYRNRCQIMSANGVLSLTVPLRGVGKKIIASEMRIDYTQKWLDNHWRAIISAYNRSPFFEYYEHEIRRILYARHDLIFDLNHEILTFCLKALALDTKITYSSAYIDPLNSDIDDLRSVIHPKSSYFDRNIHIPRPYGQVFGSTFVTNLSVMDLLFCEGPKSIQYL